MYAHFIHGLTLDDPRSYFKEKQVQPQGILGLSGAQPVGQTKSVADEGTLL